MLGSVGKLVRASAILAAGIAALAACATPSAIAPGTAESDVVGRFGRPAEVYPLPEPAQARRLAYPLGPFQQQTWMVDVDVQGRVLRVQEAISAAHFAQIRIGKDDTTAIRREFGPPRLAVPYTLTGLTAWLYPYKEDLLWNLEMSVYFDKSGVVAKLESGPDPRFLGRGNDRND